LHDPAPASACQDARLASYQTLLDISRMLLGSASIDELLARLTTGLKLLVPYDTLAVYQVDEVNRLLVPLHCVDRYAAEIMESPLEMGRGLTGWVVDHLRPQNVPQAQLDPRIELVPGTDDEPEALAVVPLIVRDAPIGTLNVHRVGENVAFTPGEFELICEFAQLVALALDNTQSRERLEREAQTDWLTGLFNHRAFHERVRDEVERAHRYRRSLSMVAFDLDDFKLLNDVHGHQEGDLTLRRVAAAALDLLRTSDVAFRVGGEEFAILLPETAKEPARAVAERLCERVRALPGPRELTVSCGVASFPDDAKNPTELLAACDAALYAAKERGKDGAAVYGELAAGERPDGSGAARRDELESLTQMRLLGALAGKLNRLNDVWQIGQTIVEELRTMVDYHNARVYVLEPTGDLVPIAFEGRVGAYEKVDFDLLRTTLGVGFTGWVGQHGEALLIDDANLDPRGASIPGTDDVDESMLVVPMRYDDAVVGVITLSKLGLGQFEPHDLRLLSILADQAATALESARNLARSEALAGELRLLLDVSTDLAASLEVGAVANVLARHLATVMAVEECAISWWDRANDRVASMGYHPVQPPGELEPFFEIADYPLTRRVLLEQTTERIDVDDPSADPAEVALLTAAGNRSLVMLPLVASGVTIGLVELISRERIEADQERLSLAWTIANEASIALENARLYGEARELADRDPLTGFFNHRSLHERFGQEAVRARRAHRPLSLVMLDLDDFKLVNDTFGHVLGDEVLRWTADIIRRTIRASDVPARYGGDEFAILLPDTDHEEAARTAERLADAFAAAMFTHGGRISVPIGVSVGIATFPADGRTAAELIAVADAGLYRMKRSRRGEEPRTA